MAADSGFDVVVTSRAEDVMAAERIVLPGQGAMADCMGSCASPVCRLLCCMLRSTNPVWRVACRCC
jgi:imidazoleglycerol phosphate synthase glutamine amidotransferase subunit HisH